MAFSGSYSISQGSDVSAFTLTDDSTDFDSNITSRTVYPYLVDGTLLGGSAIPWPKVSGVGDAITIDILSRDFSLSLVVIWNVPSPEVGGVYTKTNIVTFVGYSNEFIYTLIQQMAANPMIASDTNFLGSLSNVQTFLDSAAQATAFSDQYNAQTNLDKIVYYQNNQQLYF